MTEASRTYNVPRGTAYLTGQQVILYATYFLFYIMIARILTKVEIGQVGLLVGAQAAFSAVTQLALQPTATRFVSANLGIGQPRMAGSVAKTIMLLTFFIAGLGTIASVSLSPMLAGVVFKPSEVNSSEATLYLIMTFLSGFILDLATLYGAFFLGTGMYAEAAYQNIVYVPLSRGLGVFLALAGLRVLGITLGWTIGAVVMLLLSFYIWHGKLPHGDRYPLGPVLAFTMPLFASSLIITGQQWGDIAILQTLLGQTGTTGGYYLIISSVSFLSVLWIPVSSAVYPALSASVSLGGRREASEKLNLVLRSTNLAVFPIGVSLAALSPTALEIAFPAYVGDAIPFAILTFASVFVAEAAILTVSLQAVGKTRSLLKITLAATTVDLASVALGAKTLGPTAGALGRVLLALTTVVLATSTLRSTVEASPRAGFSQAALLAFGTGFPLLFVDQFLIRFTTMGAIMRLPILLVVFLGCFVGVARKMRIFRSDDFMTLKNLMPRKLHGLLDKAMGTKLCLEENSGEY